MQALNIRMRFLNLIISQHPKRVRGSPGLSFLGASLATASDRRSSISLTVTSLRRATTRLMKHLHTDLEVWVFYAFIPANKCGNSWRTTTRTQNQKLARAKYGHRYLEARKRGRKAKHWANTSAYSSKPRLRKQNQYALTTIVAFYSSVNIR